MPNPIMRWRCPSLIGLPYVTPLSYAIDRLDDRADYLNLRIG